MRKQFVRTIWALLAITVIAGAQTAGTGIAGRAALQRVGVSRASGVVNIEITAKGVVSPAVETLASPARIVVDLPNTVMTASLHPIRVGSDGVAGVRMGTDASKTTRVVVDLDRLCKYELVPVSADKMVLKLQTGTSESSASAQAAPAT